MNERVIFDAALQIADPQARRAFVEKACAGNPGLLAAVESLLKSHDAAGSFLDIPAAEQVKAGVSANPEDSAAADEKTRRYQPGAIDDDSEDDSNAAQPDLSFLKPSSKPGSIGVLGHYEVLSVLGQGAFGIVFKAFDESLHRLVAIKVMNPQMASTSPPRKRFLREARSAAAIKHENIVQVYSVEEQPLPYLVMEFIDGPTLKEKLDGAGPLETPEVLHIARQIASGLAAAQAMGLIHRDIKPANILLEGDEGRGPRGAGRDISSVAPALAANSPLAPHPSTLRVKISDFGLARAADDASMTRTGVISGTPMYMAPEQATGQTLDHRADLFSFGSVLYQMACGRPPFRAATTVAVLRRVVEDTPRPLQEILPEIPDWLVAIVTKLHAKKPEDRFQTAKEVADLLARCQSELQLNGKVTCVSVAPSSPVAPRQESRTSRDTDHANDSQSTSDVPRAPGLPVAERQGYLKAPKSNRRWLITGVIGIAALAAAIVFQRANNTTTTNLASREASAPGQAEPTDSTNPDVRAAEYVLSIGGTITINANGQQRDIKAVSDLPRGAFELTVVGLEQNEKVSDVGLAIFKDCKELTTLYLNNTQVSDAGLAHFQECTKLRYLYLQDTRVTDAGMAHFHKCEHIAHLHLDNTRVTDAGLVHFRQCKNMTYLHLTGTQVTDAGLANFRDCKNLARLYLGKTLVTDAGLTYIRDYPNLAVLVLNDTKVTDAGLAHFKDCQNIIGLSLNGSRVTEAGVKKLAASLPDWRIGWDGGVIEPRATDSDRRAAEYVLSIGGNIKIKDNGQERAVFGVSQFPSPSLTHL